MVDIIWGIVGILLIWFLVIGEPSILKEGQLVTIQYLQHLETK
jgi:hypothetical protein